MGRMANSSLIHRDTNALEMQLQLLLLRILQIQCLEEVLKVKELIEILWNYNQDAEITTPYSETIDVSYICIDNDGNPVDSRETPLVFIELCDYEDEDD